MKISGHGVLWDPKKNKPVARFVNGELDTDDSRIIELAKMAGFVEGDVVEEEEGESAFDRYTKDDLIELAEEKGIEIDKRWGVAKLREAVL